MSTAAERGATRNQISVDYDFRKVFVFENKYITGSYTNSTGAEKTIAQGTLMGRIAATGLLVPCVSTATDGSQYVVGVLTSSVTVEDTASAHMTLGVAGNVVENVIVLDDAGDDLDSIVDGRTYRDRVGADTVGVHLVASTELTNYDN